MTPVKISDLEERALLRPAGYLDECRRLAAYEARGRLFFEPEAYDRLLAKYKNYVPTTAQKLAGLRRSVSRWIKAGMPIAERELIEHRKAICGGCENWTGISCKACGCTGLKWGLATERCPERRW